MNLLSPHQGAVAVTDDLLALGRKSFYLAFAYGGTPGRV